jgi:hypothetical protein
MRANLALRRGKKKEYLAIIRELYDPGEITLECAYGCPQPNEPTVTVEATVNAPVENSNVNQSQLSLDTILYNIQQSFGLGGTSPYLTVGPITEEITGLVPALVRIVMEVYRVASKAQEFALSDRKRAEKMLRDLDKFINKQAEYIGEKFNYTKKRYLKVWDFEAGKSKRMSYTKVDLQAFALTSFRLAVLAGIRDKRDEVFRKGVTNAE